MDVHVISINGSKAWSCYSFKMKVKSMPSNISLQNAPNEIIKWELNFKNTYTSLKAENF